LRAVAADPGVDVLGVVEDEPRLVVGRWLRQPDELLELLVGYVHARRRGAVARVPLAGARDRRVDVHLHQRDTDPLRDPVRTAPLEPPELARPVDRREAGREQVGDLRVGRRVDALPVLVAPASFAVPTVGESSVASSAAVNG
jgi:hypothetical protein